MQLNEFADKVLTIMPVLLKEFARTPSLSCSMTLPQMLTLNYLAKTGAVSMKTLAGFMNCSTAAATGMVDRLVRAGLVIRSMVPQDRRVIKVRITGKGQRLVKETIEKRRETIVRVFGRLSETDRNDYLRVLFSIQRNLIAGEADK